MGIPHRRSVPCPGRTPKDLRERAVACEAGDKRDEIARQFAISESTLYSWLQQYREEAANNHVERMLRPGVITRKTGGCNRNPPGARTHEVLASILVTLRQHGRDALSYLHAVRTAPGPLPDRFPVPTPQHA